MTAVIGTSLEQLIGLQAGLEREAAVPGAVAVEGSTWSVGQPLSLPPKWCCRPERDHGRSRKAAD